jgi:hypothetical protein
MKKWLFLTISILFLSVMTGCVYNELNYQGKVRPVQEVEEMLEDYLESENPDYEFKVEVTIE